MQRGSTVRSVIESQAEVWVKALAAPVPEFNLQGRILCVGSGTSYYLAMVVAELGRKLGLDITARPTQDVILEGRELLQRFDGMVVISRSGETSEALWSAEMASAAHMDVLGVTCNDAAPLINKVDTSWVYPDAHDHTVVMVRSFSTMLLAFQQALTKRAQNSGAQDALARMADSAQRFIREADEVVGRLVAKPPRRVYILGAGVRYGIALEGSLKCLEMSNENAAAYGPLEFRHGPWGSVTDEDLVVMLGQEAYAAHERQVVRDLSHRTAHILTVGKKTWFQDAQTIPGTALTLPVEDDLLGGPLAVVPLQWLGWYWAMAQGQDPDEPKNLTPVVDLNYGSY